MPPARAGLRCLPDDSGWQRSLLTHDSAANRARAGHKRESRYTGLMNPPLFEELDYRDTPLGEISLRRRQEPRAGNVLVYEVKLNDEFLMSSLFTVGERALAERAIERAAAELPDARCDVVVGGLGLGFTAEQVLAAPQPSELLVIEALAPVIRWHQQGLVPLGEVLSNDPRCRLINGDFFRLAASEDGFDPGQPGRRFDVIALDIDHAPGQYLNDAHETFYTAAGLAGLARHLHPNGVFAMWSNDRPDPEFIRKLQQSFELAQAELVEFDNPYNSDAAFCSIYLAQRPIHKRGGPT